MISEKVGRNLVTHVYERTFSAGGSIALLRHSMLRNWPPRYGDNAGPIAADLAEVSESEAGDPRVALTLRKPSLRRHPTLPRLPRGRDARVATVGEARSAASVEDTSPSSLRPSSQFPPKP